MTNALFYSPVKGVVKDITECSDPVFSEKMMGDGILVKPEDNKIIAPCDGIINTLVKTKHAITMYNKHQIPLIIHVGIDTVELNGEGFVAYVKNGDVVKKGQLLLEVDFDYLKHKGFDTDTIMLIADTNVPIKAKFIEKNYAESNIVMQVEISND